ncbi:MAG: hypothetical protein M3280_02425, partial [Actinomycetota bacterium]|nr:hypothetical protein [Actinomycetota bacterium]
GDTFAPDISILKVSSESLLAAASSPGAGAFGLAEAALQAALADEANPGDVPSADELEDLEGAQGDVHSDLAHLLEDGASVSPPAGD